MKKYCLHKESVKCKMVIQIDYWLGMLKRKDHWICRYDFCRLFNFKLLNINVWSITLWRFSLTSKFYSRPENKVLNLQHQLLIPIFCGHSIYLRLLFALVGKVLIWLEGCNSVITYIPQLTKQLEPIDHFSCAGNRNCF